MELDSVIGQWKMLLVSLPPQVVPSEVRSVDFWGYRSNTHVGLGRRGLGEEMK